MTYISNIIIIPTRSLWYLLLLQLGPTRTFMSFTYFDTTFVSKVHGLNLVQISYGLFWKFYYVLVVLAVINGFVAEQNHVLTFACVELLVGFLRFEGHEVVFHHRLTVRLVLDILSFGSVCIFKIHYSIPTFFQRFQLLNIFLTTITTTLLRIIWPHFTYLHRGWHRLYLIIFIQQSWQLQLFIHFLYKNLKNVNYPKKFEYLPYTNQHAKYLIFS